MTSTILGPLAGVPNTGVLEETFVFTNNGSPVNLDTVTGIDLQLDDSWDDGVAYDAATGAVFAWEPAPDVAGPYLMAVIADDTVGTLDVCEVQIVNAEICDDTFEVVSMGTDALSLILCWNSGTIEEASCTEPVSHTIHEPWQSLLLTSVRKGDEPIQSE